MTRTSWLKKIWKGRSKGVSTVIGTVFLMLIIFMVSTNVLLWTFSQNALYTQAEKDVNQDEADRRNENVIASDVKYSVPSEGKVNVETELTNAGSVAVQIVNLWVFDNTNQTYGFNNTIGSLNLNLNPGNIRTVSVVVTVPGAGQNHKFNSFFVTARGNVVPLKEKEEKEIIRAEVAQGIGAISMNFSTFKYHEVNSSDYLGPANYSFTIPGSKRTVFGVVLTNLDESGEAINLTSSSCIWALTPFGGTVKGDSWSITKVKNNKLATFDFQILTYNTPTEVYFGAHEPTFIRGEVVPVNILLFGKIGNNDYGQNIPFIALYITS